MRELLDAGEVHLAVAAVPVLPFAAGGQGLSGTDRLDGFLRGLEMSEHLGVIALLEGEPGPKPFFPPREQPEQDLALGDEVVLKEGAIAAGQLA